MPQVEYDIINPREEAFKRLLARLDSIHSLTLGNEGKKQIEYPSTKIDNLKTIGIKYAKMIVFPRKNQILIRDFRIDWGIPEYEGFLKEVDHEDFDSRLGKVKVQYKEMLEKVLGKHNPLSLEEQDRLLNFMMGDLDYESTEFKDVYNKKLAELICEDEIFFDDDEDDRESIQRWAEHLKLDQFMQETYQLTEQLTKTANISALLWRQFVYYFTLSSRIALKPLGAYASTYMHDKILNINNKTYVDLSPELNQKEFFAVIKEFREKKFKDRRQPDSYDVDAYHELLKQRYSGKTSKQIAEAKGSKNYAQVNKLLDKIKKNHPEWL